MVNMYVCMTQSLCIPKYQRIFIKMAHKLWYGSDNPIAFLRNEKFDYLCRMVVN